MPPGVEFFLHAKVSCYEQRDFQLFSERLAQLSEDRNPSCGCARLDLTSVSKWASDILASALSACNDALSGGGFLNHHDVAGRAQGWPISNHDSV